MCKNCKKEYNRGFRDGESKQAILELQGRDMYLDSVTNAANELFGKGSAQKLKRKIYEVHTATLGKR